MWRHSKCLVIILPTSGRNQKSLETVTVPWLWFLNISPAQSFRPAMLAILRSLPGIFDDWQQNVEQLQPERKHMLHVPKQQITVPHVPQWGRTNIPGSGWETQSKNCRQISWARSHKTHLHRHFSNHQTLRLQAPKLWSTVFCYLSDHGAISQLGLLRLFSRVC